MARKTKSKKTSQPHDAKTGRFVSEKYAKAHPNTTVNVTVKK